MDYGQNRILAVAKEADHLTRNGIVQDFLQKPTLKSSGGIFSKSNKADMYLAYIAQKNQQFRFQ